MFSLETSENQPWFAETAFRSICFSMLSKLGPRWLPPVCPTDPAIQKVLPLAWPNRPATSLAVEKPVHSRAKITDLTGQAEIYTYLHYY
jgi:hypothetical protein